MSKEYHEHGFLLEIDDYALIQQYLDTQHITGFSYEKPAGRRKGAEAIAERIEAVLRAQSEEKQQEIERDFQRIALLANEKGAQNLMAEAAEQGVVPTAAQAIEQNLYDRAFWFFLTHPHIFDEAEAVQQFYDLSGWKRVPVPTKPVSFVEGRKDALVEALKKHFTETDGRGKYGDAVMYAKQNRIYVVGRFTGYAENNFVPDEKSGRLVKQGTRRPPFEVYYLYRPNEGDKGGGELEIKARGGWQKQRDLLAVFTQSVFNYELDDSKQTFNLELLKNPHFPLVAEPEDMMEWWWLKGIELRTPDRLTSVRITTANDSRGGVAPIWDQLRRFNVGDKIGSMLVNNADFQIKFKPTKKWQKGTVTFNINWKDACTLNSINEFHIKARRVLKQSKLDCGFGT